MNATIKFVTASVVAYKTVIIFAKFILSQEVKFSANLIINSLNSLKMVCPNGRFIEMFLKKTRNLPRYEEKFDTKNPMFVTRDGIRYQINAHRIIKTKTYDKNTEKNRTALELFFCLDNLDNRPLKYIIRGFIMYAKDNPRKIVPKTDKKLRINNKTFEKFFIVV